MNQNVKATVVCVVAKTRYINMLKQHVRCITRKCDKQDSVMYLLSDRVIFAKRETLHLSGPKSYILISSH